MLYHSKLIYRSMKYLKYFESRYMVSEVDMLEIEDIFKEYSDKYFISKTDKLITRSAGAPSQSVYHIGLYHVALGWGLFYDTLEVVIDIYIDADPTIERAFLNDINSFKDRLLSIGYEVITDDLSRFVFSGFYTIRVRI